MIYIYTHIISSLEHQVVLDQSGSAGNCGIQRSDHRIHQPVGVIWNADLRYPAKQEILSKFLAGL